MIGRKGRVLSYLCFLYLYCGHYYRCPHFLLRCLSPLSACPFFPLALTTTHCCLCLRVMNTCSLANLLDFQSLKLFLTCLILLYICSVRIIRQLIYFMIKDLEVTRSRTSKTTQGCLWWTMLLLSSFPSIFNIHLSSLPGLKKTATLLTTMFICWRGGGRKGKVKCKSLFFKRFWLFTQDVKPGISFHILLAKTLHPDRLCKKVVRETGVTGVKSVLLTSLWSAGRQRGCQWAVREPASATLTCGYLLPLVQS